MFGGLTYWGFYFQIIEQRFTIAATIADWSSKDIFPDVIRYRVVRGKE